MSVHEWVDQEIVRLTDIQSFGEDAQPDAELDELDILDTAEALSYVEAHIRAARQLQGWLKERLAEQVGKSKHKAFMYGNTLYRVQPKREWVIDDIDSLVSLLGDDVPVAFRLDRHNLRTTALKKIAADREIGDTLDSMVYKRTVEGEWELNTPPMKNWPKFLADMTDGELR